MTGIVLSAAVRQNLLSLQSTSQLLATTQNDLATGNKVNSALDNPTNYFTASALNSRASDISNLLDSVGNGVQVLQAANTGITSLKSLLDSAKSIANQALQASSGYSQKSQFSATITGADANNLLGGTSTNATAAAGTAISDVTSTSGAITGNTYASKEFVGGGGSNDEITIDGTTITFDGTTDGSTAIADSSTHKYTITEAIEKINHDLTAAGSTISAAEGTGADAGKIVLTNSATGGSSNFTVDVTSTSGGGGFDTGAAQTTTSGGSTGGIDASGGAITFNVNGKTVTLSDTGGTDGHYSASDIASLINSQVGTSAKVNATADSGKLTITSTGTAGTSDQVKLDNFTGGIDATDLGYAAATETDNGTHTGGLSGLTLTIGATGDGTATNITFGSNDGQISTLNDLNSALAANNLMATIDTNGKLTISTTNNNASKTIGDVGGTATDSGNPFAASVGAQTAPVADAGSQQTRAGLVSQFNTILEQIKTTAQDSSFNGVNLLNGDLLQLTFNETGTSTLNIQGNIDDPAGLGLSSLTAGVDFLDNAGTNKIISAINNASNVLDSQASTLGSNLSIVQIRQKFSTSMINVLQTGASNLTLADPNELAADSQALSTRQSIAVSALALANQSQQSVLQLLQG